MFTTKFWADLGERSVKTFAQDLGAALATAGLSLTVTNWRAALINAGVATLLSALSSLGSLPVGDRASASLIRTLQHGRHQAGR